MIDAVVEFGSRPFVGFVVGSILGIGGIALSIIFYFWTRTKTKLSYARSDAVVLNVTNAKWNEEFEIKYRGVVVPRVTVSAVGFWNGGTETISGDQIIDCDALRLRVPDGCKIVGTEVRSATREVINPSYKKIDDTTVLVKFDYLDRGDGFIIRLSHSGEYGSLSVLGTLRGIPEGLTPWRKKRQGLLSEITKSLTSGAIFWVAAAGILQVRDLFPRPQSSGYAKVLAITGIILVGAGLLSVVVFTSRWLENRRKSPVPATLRNDPTFASALSQ